MCRLVQREELGVQYSHLPELEDVNRANDDERGEESSRSLKESLIEHYGAKVLAQHFTEEDAVVAEHDHDGPHEGQGKNASHHHEPSDIASRYEHLEVVSEDIGLIRAERNREQVLGPSRPIGHSVPIDVKRDVPTSYAGGHGKHHPNECALNQRELVVILRE